MSELAYLSWIEAGQQIRLKQLSPVAYCEALLERINTYDASLNAFIHITKDAALKEAESAERALQSDTSTLGLLHGIPFALKDIIDVGHLPTTAHSKILINNIAQADAHVTAKIRAAGGILLGKLATHEFAFGGPCFDLPWPPARNPWDRRMFTGGSSSGSGCAIAAGFVPIALGSDTAGSIRNPASLCGIVGMKATYGRVSRRGVIPLSYSLDHVGPMTRSVAENAGLLNIIAGHDPLDTGSANVVVPDYLDAVQQGQGDGLSGMRIGVIRHFYQQDFIADPVIDGGIESALEVLARLGAEIIEVRTWPLEEFTNANRVILTSEAYAVHEHWLQTRPEDYAEMTRSKLLPGAFIRAVDYLQETRNRVKFIAEIDRLLSEVDVLVTASNMDPAAPIDDEIKLKKSYPRHARAPFNLTGHPALSLPVGFTNEVNEPQLPLSMQIVGRHFDEATIYQVAAAYEQATPWKDSHPSIETKLSKQ